MRPKKISFKQLNAATYGGIMDFGALVANIGSLAGALGVVELIKFFVSRKDKKQERKEDREDSVNNLRVELKRHLTDVNADWKATYCDKNAAAIKEVSQDVIDIKDTAILTREDIAQMKEQNLNMGFAINGIIHDRIIHNVDSYIERGGITQEELATLQSMYVPYSKLGGNGAVETAWKIANDLPVIPKCEALKRDQMKKAILNAMA